jgi:hypothetical protein
MFQGADVNGGNHEHDYTTLHFASLAGKVEICKLLLQNGVKIERTNSVRRTASQMAAFVGMKAPQVLRNSRVQVNIEYKGIIMQPQV